MDLRDLFFTYLINQMKKNKKMILLSVDMGSQVVNANIKYLKNQYINVGVSEANAISLAAGLSSRGYIPYVYGISSFIFNRPRAQIRQDAIIANNNITIIGSGAGLTYSQDGPSHHPVEDYTALASFPNSKLIIPFDKKSSIKANEIAIKKKTTNFIKLDKGKTYNLNFTYKDGFYFKLRNKKKWIFTTGMEVNNIVNNEKYHEYSIGVLFESSKKNLNFIKQFINPKTKVVISDESFTIGGVYSYICTLLSLVNNKYIINKTLNNKFIQKKYDRKTLRKKYETV
tara:strand:+ start:536 stop:1390 length:855 start_codon:yes stop_codon:yes gene_type:complete